jgi:hypothetical protein
MALLGMWQSLHYYVKWYFYNYYSLYNYNIIAGVTGLPGSNVKLEQAMGSTAVDDSSRKREVRLMKNRYIYIPIHTILACPA